MYLEKHRLYNWVSVLYAILKFTPQRGRTPKMYNKFICGFADFANLQREAFDADLNIYIFRTNFEEVFHQALKVNKTK